MQLNVTVCNVCQSVGRSTLPYTIGEGSRSAKVDLCAEHGAPLEKLLPGRTGRPPAALREAAGQNAEPKKTTARKASATKKTAAKKTAAKKTPGRRGRPVVPADQIKTPDDAGLVAVS